MHGRRHGPGSQLQVFLSEFVLLRREQLHHRAFGVSGSYVVRCDSPEVGLELRHQQGIWSCEFIRAIGAPNPDDAHRVWVYHDGVEEGPINSEDFNRGLLAGQWPPNAVVGLNDPPTWSTAADCLQRIQAEVAARN